MRAKYQMKETILATVTRAFSPRIAGYSNHYSFTVTAQAYQLGENQHPHFSVTADVTHKASGSMRAGGCMHKEALRAWPSIAPIIALHLCNADDGAPGYEIENGFYRLAGAVPPHHFGQQYHSGNSKQNFPCVPPVDKPWMDTVHRFPTSEECLASLAEFLRVSVDQAADLRADCVEAYELRRAKDDSLGSMEGGSDVTPNAAAVAAAKAVFAAFVDAQRPRWKKEAQAGLALIRSMKAQQQQKAA